MENLLTVKSSRISSLKSLFFPAKFEFNVDERGNLKVYSTTRNWIGQKTKKKEIVGHVRIKGFILRKVRFSGNTNTYGRFWFSDCKKISQLLKEKGEGSLEWSDTWF